MTNRIDSIWKKVERHGHDECWPWLGRASADGYGRVDVMRHKGVYAHRVAYLAANPDSISLRFDGICVCHHCDNPRCCNPAHLFLGTQKENMEDMVSKGRSNKHSGSRAPRAKLSDEDVQDIRAKKKSGATKNALALLYDVSVATIGGCLYGRHYQ